MKPVRLCQRGRALDVRLEKDAAVLGDRLVPFEREDREGMLERLVVGGRAHWIVAAREGDRIFVWCDGTPFSFDRLRGARATAGPEHEGDLLAPMPGKVRRIFATAGDRVTRGQPLLVLEAMKMEHSIRAPKDGVVKRMLVREGDLVDSGVELAEIT